MGSCPTIISRMLPQLIKQTGQMHTLPDFPDAIGFQVRASMAQSQSTNEVKFFTSHLHPQSKSHFSSSSFMHETSPVKQKWEIARCTSGIHSTQARCTPYVLHPCHCMPCDRSSHGGKWQTMHRCRIGFFVSPSRQRDLAFTGHG